MVGDRTSHPSGSRRRGSSDERPQPPAPSGAPESRLALPAVPRQKERSQACGFPGWDQRRMVHDRLAVRLWGKAGRKAFIRTTGPYPFTSENLLVECGLRLCERCAERSVRYHARGDGGRVRRDESRPVSAVGPLPAFHKPSPTPSPRQNCRWDGFLLWAPSSS